MVDALLRYLRQSLPTHIVELAEPYITRLEKGDYEGILGDPEAQALFGHVNDSKTENVKFEDFPSWSDFIFHRLGILLADRRRPEKQSVYFCIGYAALLAFLQSNVTGPPLHYNPAELLLPSNVAEDDRKLQSLRASLLETLGMDGIAAYRLTRNVELLCLADAIFTCPPILKYIKPARWAKLRVAFLQQKLLSEVSSSLQEVIHDDLELLEEALSSANHEFELHRDLQIEFLLERATIYVHHGLDKFAREDLDKAAQKRRFEFALTGALGKRTKFQQKDTSQLFVLATSSPESADVPSFNGDAAKVSTNGKPTSIDLNDDTLLESISFAQKNDGSAKVVDEGSLPSSLAALDPSSQPQLHSLDSAILLATASSITSTSIQHGLTREETLPYANRVLEGGSSNWQVYTQALLVRSRIEGYNARTVERSLLQLQALVDQVIAATASDSISKQNSEVATQSTSFLAKPKEGDSHPATERLRYVFQLASPYRWTLEAELASRWVQLGGLRSALDIYERLEMWAEAALCWAATEQEDKARLVVRRQLFYATGGGPDQAESEVKEDETWTGPPRDSPPPDAPRLYCILGDLDQSIEMYEKAWEVSDQRYARAQRSLGRHYFATKDFLKAADAYSKSLRANQLNQASWFALGCALLELAQFRRAAEAFSRCVQLDESDAESWSNLAAALLSRGSSEDAEIISTKDSVNGDGQGDSDETRSERQSDHEQDKQNALKALKRAATLKHDSYRIWENVLIVSASLSPPDYASILEAQRSIIDLRGATDGEKCIDVEILDHLIRHVISLSDQYDPSQPGLQRMAVKFIDERVVPLITGSAELWRLVSKLALWRNKPSTALDAEEKAWRAITSQPGWETESGKRWDEVVEATVRLCDSYESLGPRERTEGMGIGEPVAKDRKFKARTAIRGILGRGKQSWEGSQGWEKLKDTMDGLKG